MVLYGVSPPRCEGLLPHRMSDGGTTCTQLFWFVSDAQLALYSYNRSDTPKQFVGDPPGPSAQPSRLRPLPAPAPEVAALSTAGRRLAAGLRAAHSITYMIIFQVPHHALSRPPVHTNPCWAHRRAACMSITASSVSQQ